MDLFYVALTSVGSIITLFIMTKIMGNRQISQMSMFDYIVGITIGSIAAEMATALEDFAKPAVSLVIYALAGAGLSLLTRKSIIIRRFVTGESLILFMDGRLFRDNLKKSRLDLSEFLTHCRGAGYFNLADLQLAIFEANGKISFLPRAVKRPLTPEDMSLYPPEQSFVVTVISDGKVLPDNLKFTGNDERWLERQLREQGIRRVADVFLATCDRENKLSAYVKVDAPMSRDPFE